MTVGARVFVGDRVGLGVRSSVVGPSVGLRDGENFASPSHKSS